ncbi:MAG TPA: hypothetical protein VLA05_03595, partial [Coriobacteriia bacterium]|nr:hypothetical protein [Coriobacteriia bacterium]
GAFLLSELGSYQQPAAAVQPDVIRILERARLRLSQHSAPAHREKAEKESAGHSPNVEGGIWR